MRKYIFIPLLILCMPLLSKGQGTLLLGITGYDANCNSSNSGSAVATLSGGTAPYSYLWAPGAATTDSVSGLAAGIYSVTVTDSAGNTVSGTITINQPAPLTVSIDSIVVLPCFRTTGAVCGCNNTLWAIVGGGTPPYSYLWTPGGGTGDTLFNACYVEFTVTVSDSNNCVTADSIDVLIPNNHSSSSGIAQTSNTNDINIYPNPANTQLNVTCSATGNRTLAVYDMIGRKVYELQPCSNESLITIDVSGLADGNYFLRIDGEEATATAHFSIVR